MTYQTGGDGAVSIRFDNDELLVIGLLLDDFTRKPDVWLTSREMEIISAIRNANRINRVGFASRETKDGPREAG